MPLAFVDLDLFNQNVQDILPKAGGKKIRIASKSARVPELTKRIIDTSEVYQGLMCYLFFRLLVSDKPGRSSRILHIPLKKISAFPQFGQRHRAFEHIAHISQF